MSEQHEAGAGLHDESAPRRNGGDLVVETLQALGATRAFGIPGQHALGLFDAMGRGRLDFLSSRVENNSAFAADGYSRATDRPGVLFLSTGPGALTSLAGLQEAYATGVPMIVVASQIPAAGLGARRRGMLHQLDEQRTAASQVTKSQRTVLHTSAIPSAIRDAWREAVTAPQGPVWVEVPQDILLESVDVPPVVDVSGEPHAVPARAELVEQAARLLTSAKRPLIIAGGGVRRGNAEAALVELAEALRAPVLMAPGGKGSIGWEHPLSLRSWVEDVHMTELAEDADVLLAIGTSLGEVTSNYYTLAPRGRLIQIDAESRVLESNHPALGIHADAGAALPALVAAVAALPGAAPDWHGASPEEVVATALRTVDERLTAQDVAPERRFLDDIRAAVPDSTATFWDMTIAGYWAWSYWDARSGQFHTAQGAGGIGWSYGAAIGGAEGLGERVLAVSGDGSAMYSIPELATARQHDTPVTWLIVDDGGYGILREYMEGAFGQATATELARPDFVALAEAFGVPAKAVSPDAVGPALTAALAADGPNVVVVQTKLRMFAATHMGRPTTL